MASSNLNSLKSNSVKKWFGILPENDEKLREQGDIGDICTIMAKPYPIPGFRKYK